MKHIFTTFVLLTLVAFNYTQAQRKSKPNDSFTTFNEKLYNGINWRHIGPFRGGRSAAVTGVKGKANLFYMGSTGGGVWKSSDAGNSWTNISDGFFGGSIGSIAVSDWDNNVIYAGGGEVTVRGNVSSGSGIFKTMDAGKTWSFVGLPNSRHIPRIRIHPKNPDLVYAAVLGDLYKSSNDRGVYRSKDGGKNWEKILFANSDAGAVDLVMDPNNSRILYASTWKIRRTPYSLESGGEGSALWKSIDGGDNWINISNNKGLPKNQWGISGITVSPVNSDRIWAIIENNEGGVFRSDDAGKTWVKINEDRKLRQRAWYYTRIYADTKDVDMVYVLNVSYHKSKDGGKTFESSNAPHGDHHDLWIAPEDNQRMIMGDDGGAQISFDAGENWSTYLNQPTAQFYRVTTDNHFPYRIYGAQQDNSTIRISHRTSGGFITEKDWEATAGGESAHIAVDPSNNDIVYGGSYGGFLSRVNHITEEIRAINVWPDNPMGHGAIDFKYRFQWNFPIFISPHSPKKLYAASNHLHLSTNEGQSWKVISPDLTRNDSSKLGSSGGPITQDNTSVEYYGTIFTITESPIEEGLIWSGSDDGLLYLTTNGGNNWKNVTPKGMPEWMMFNSIEVDPFIKGGAYVVGTRYKSGDYSPYIYKTKDYGKTWSKITNGIGFEHFTRVLRADPSRKGLLYAGTENGIYISFDDGLKWSPFQLNLPLVPITDLTIKNDNLIAATQGRSFWIIDDLTPLHQLNNEVKTSNTFLYKPMDSYRLDGGNYDNSKTEGENHPGGVMVHFYIKDTTKIDTVRLSFLEKEGKKIRTFSNYPDKEKKEGKLEIKPDMNRFVWDMKYQGADDFEGMILWWSSLDGPTALPGNYKVQMSVNGKLLEQNFNILKDPRSSSSFEDLKSQFDFLSEVNTKLTETNVAIKKIRLAKEQIKLITTKMESDTFKDIKLKADTITNSLSTIEEALYQTKNRSNQDPLNFPIKLNNKLAHLNSLQAMGDFQPTDQAKAFKKEITAQIDNELEKLNSIFSEDISELNEMIKNKKVDAIIIND